MMERLNYTTHALADLIRYRDYQRRDPRCSPLATEWMMARLREAQKFILPENGELIDITLQQHTLDAVKLPYPVCVLEAPFTRPFDPQPGDLMQVASSRRIALLVEATRGQVNATFPAVPIPGDPSSSGVVVMVVSYIDSQKTWAAYPAALFYEYEQKVRTPGVDGFSAASKLVIAEARSPGRNAFRIQIVVTMPYEFAPAISADPVRSQATVLADTRDEAIMMIQFCNVINCANVETDMIPVPAKLQRAREKAGKLPLYEYRTLVVTDDRRRSAGEGDAGSGNDSRRQHLRRGHLRRLPDRTIWVRPTVVNPGVAQGVIAKDYVVRTASRGA